MQASTSAPSGILVTFVSSSILPPIPPQPGGLVIFSPAQWRWIGQAFQTIHNDNEAIVQILGPIASTLENLLMSMSDLNAAQDRSEASTTAALAAISTEIQQVRDAVAALGDAPTAAELTALKSRIEGNADRIDAAVAAMQADDPTPPTP